MIRVDNINVIFTFLRKNFLYLTALAVILVSSAVVGLLPSRLTILLPIIAIGIFLASLTLVSRELRNRAVVIMLVVLPLVSILKAITGSRFAPLVFDLGLLFACILHFADGVVRGKLRLGKLDFLLFTLWAMALVQIFNPNVPSFNAGVEGFRKFIFMSIAFYISRHMLNARHLRMFAKGMIIVSIPVIFYGIKQFIQLSPIDHRMIAMASASAETYFMDGWIRPFSTLPGTFQLGAFLVISMLLIIASLGVLRIRPSIRFPLFGLLALQLILLMMTRTKGNWGGFVVGVITLIVLQSRNPLKAIIRLAVLGILGAVLWYVIYAISPPGSLRAIDQAILAITDPLNAPTFIFRMDLWKESVIPAIQDRMFIGYGTSSAAEGLSPLFENTTSQFFATHNLYLKVIVELGLIGFLSFAILLGASLFNGLRGLKTKYRKDTKIALFLRWGVAVVISFLVAGFFIPLLDAYPVNYYFWLLLGLLSRAQGVGISE